MPQTPVQEGTYWSPFLWLAIISSLLYIEAYYNELLYSETITGLYKILTYGMLMVFVVEIPNTNPASRSIRVVSHKTVVIAVIFTHAFGEVILEKSNLFKTGMLIIYGGHILLMYTYFWAYVPSTIPFVLTMLFPFVTILILNLVEDLELWELWLFFCILDLMTVAATVIRANGKYPRIAAIIGAYLYFAADAVSLLIHYEPSEDSDYIEIERIRATIVITLRYSAAIATAIGAMDQEAHSPIEFYW